MDKLIGISMSWDGFGCVRVVNSGLGFDFIFFLFFLWLYFYFILDINKGYKVTLCIIEVWHLSKSQITQLHNTKKDVEGFEIGNIIQYDNNILAL